MTLFESFSGLIREPLVLPLAHGPLIIALHGGTYTSAYFDVPGYSLLDRAGANGMRALAPDRNGYGDTPALPGAEATISGHARSLTAALHTAWRHYGDGCSGMVLIGHSIGGAIALQIASEPDGLPLLGLAVSGVGLRTPQEYGPMWESLPDTPLVEMPSSVKDQVMFGPPDSFNADAMPASSYAANAPAPKAELVDIVSTWHDKVHGILERIAVPVHYRQGEFDRLWIVDEDEVSEFARALVRAPRVDAAMLHGTGHCMDFHHVGAALQVQQLGFALQCAAEAFCCIESRSAAEGHGAGAGKDDARLP